MSCGKAKINLKNLLVFVFLKKFGYGLDITSSPQYPMRSCPSVLMVRERVGRIQGCFFVS